MSEKISLATVYNTIHAFEKKGYLKQISAEVFPAGKKVDLEH